MNIVSPTTLAHQTIKYENTAIHTILPMNVTIKNFRPVIKNQNKVITSTQKVRKKN